MEVNKKIDYKNDLYDLCLIDRIKNGDEVAFRILINRYKGLYWYLKNYVFSFKLREDEYYSIFLKSLYESAITFNKEKNIKFSNFFRICFRRRIVDYIIYNNRQKRNKKNCLSLDKKMFFQNPKRKQNEEGRMFYDILHDEKSPNPLDIVIYKETINEFWKFCVDEFTDLELLVFKGYLELNSQKAIAKKYNLSPKSVDNALCRVKRKINKKFKNKSLLLEYAYKTKYFV